MIIGIIFAFGNVFPMENFTASIQNIMLFVDWKIQIPIWLVLLLYIFGYNLILLVILGGVLWIGWRQKNLLETYSLSLLIFAVPLILSLIG